MTPNKDIVKSWARARKQAILTEAITQLKEIETLSELWACDCGGRVHVSRNHN